MTHPETIEIDARYNGPPGSANGGYAAGVFAALVDGPAEVNLRAPPPLDRPIRVTTTAQGFEFFDGDTLVASSGPAGFLPPPPDAPTTEQALQWAEATSPRKRPTPSPPVSSAGRTAKWATGCASSPARLMALTAWPTSGCPLRNLPGTTASCARKSCGQRSTVPAPSPSL